MIVLDLETEETRAALRAGEALRRTLFVLFALPWRKKS